MIAEEEAEKEKEERREASKTKKETRVSPKPSAKPKIGFYKPQKSCPGGHLQVETARSATSPGGTRRPAVTLIGLANPADQEPTQTYQVRGLRSQSEIRQGSGPDPSERLELNPRPPSQSRSERSLRPPRVERECDSCPLVRVTWSNACKN